MTDARDNDTSVNFKDEGNNIHRWLICLPLVLRHPVTNSNIQVHIKEDFEPLYNFLEFCRLQNSGLAFGGEYCETLTMLVQASETIPQNGF